MSASTTQGSNGSSMADQEALAQNYGREIFARLHGRDPWLFSPRWWDERLMQWTMDNETVKVQLFRFIDVLPLLNTPPEVNRHLREYFTQASPNLPRWMQRAVRWMPSDGLSGRLLARAARHNAERLARRFIAGSNLEETLQAVAKLRQRSLAFTLDLLGEATITESEAEQYQAQYLEMLEGLSRQVNAWKPIPLIDSDPSGPLPRVNVSIKLSSLYSQFDPIDPVGTSRAGRARLRPVLELARRNRAFVNVDMEQYAYKDLTLQIFKEILTEPDFRDWPDAGIAIQAYLLDTPRDLESLAAWTQQRGTPVWVRLIKGAYWDYETVVAAQQDWPVPVFVNKWQTDAQYERLTRLLLERHRWLRPAFGSHNIRSISNALAVADDLGLPPRSFEFQMLYGMAEPVQDALASLGHRVRIYTPFGQLLPGMAYLVRRLLENTANESFLRASFTEHVPEEQLLMNPSLKAERTNHAPSPNAHPVAESCRNEPLTDFSRAEAREAMQQALRDVAGQLGRRYSLVIGGQTIATEAHLESINPSHRRQIVGYAPKATPAQAEQAILAARKALPGWRDTSARDRAEYFFRAAKVMKLRRFELAAWQVYECGKQWREADADVAEAIDYCNYYAEEMLRLAKPQHHDVPGEENVYSYEPRGVCVTIAPWNFPLAILCGMTAAAAVTGNTVVMKPAEQSAVTGAKLMEVFQEVGLPAGVVNFLSGVGEEIGPILIHHRDVALISFTGSKGVGLLINREAADTPPGQDHVKRVLAEMGGKNAIIIDEDADLDEAVSGVAASAFGYQGQKCSACSRAIVLEPIYDLFLTRLVEATRSKTIAPAEDPGSFIGPVIDAEAFQRIKNCIEAGKKEAPLAYAGSVGDLEQEGYYIAPHIFAEASPSASLAQEEIFGPVLSVIRAKDLDEALAIANDTPYALTGGLYSRSPESIARIRREYRVGNLYINRKITGALVCRQPFGGFKLSGIGAKAGGPDYLLQFVQPRTITENTMRRGFAPAAQAQLSSFAGE